MLHALGVEPESARVFREEAAHVDGSRELAPGLTLECLEVGHARQNLNLFDDLYAATGGNVAETIRAVQVRVFTQSDGDPYRALYSRAGPQD